jgi:hypothetical protein
MYEYFYCFVLLYIYASIYVYVFIVCLSIHCMFIYLHRAIWHSLPTLTEVFPCFLLSCKTNARVKPAKLGHGPHSSKFFVLFYVLVILCRSVYCLCVNVY